METLLTGPATQSVFAIEDASQTAVVRRAGVALAKMHGFSDALAGRVALVITEAATNILKHAGRGRIMLRAVADGGTDAGNGCGTASVEILAVDAGPGIANLPLSMADGQSATGTYGNGLGIMRRQADAFDVYTAPSLGVAIYMSIGGVAGGRVAGPVATAAKVGVVCLPLAGEEACGDAWTAVESHGGLSLLLVDGLGHGPEAARAAQAAVMAVEASPGSLPVELIWKLHAALSDTRGAAAAVARVDFQTRQLTFAGVGNVAAAIFQGESRRHIVSHNGIVGSNVRTVQDFHYPWTSESLLVMHSDGIDMRWDLQRYPGLILRHPSLIAAVLNRDFARTSDDATVLVVRGTDAPP
ncbi:MAG: SpoIIE family protein phosphatase [Pseudomonadota bacterium]|nr:SpoIIE family protein phosphatase [Pseudomonadota bacterium]